MNVTTTLHTTEQNRDDDNELLPTFTQVFNFTFTSTDHDEDLICYVASQEVARINIQFGSKSPYFCYSFIFHININITINNYQDQEHFNS